MCAGAAYALVGQDAYAPIAGVARSRGWGSARTALFAAACAVLHAVSSTAVAGLGLGAGWALRSLPILAPRAPEWAAWMAVAGGVAYAAWAIRRARAAGPDGHTHGQAGSLHAFDHIHDPQTGTLIAITPAILLAIYAFSPCAPLALLLVHPAATGGWAAAWVVAACYGASAVACRVGATAAAGGGARALPMGTWGRYGGALTGACAALAGAALLAAG